MDIIIIVILIVIIILQMIMIHRLNQLRQSGDPAIERLSKELQNSFERIEKNFKEDFRINREESRLIARDNREELSRSLNDFQQTFERGIASFNQLQKEKFETLDDRQQKLILNTEKRLEEIRTTVDEKLQKTLNERIGQSFRLVTEQLESVQKGLGEMQSLAQDVGGLKRVLSNVKTRGNIGEIQLSLLLEQLLAPEQYEANVHTKKGSDAVVEFAIKLPGNEREGEFIYLPIDAKFPKDVYEQLLDAYDSADSSLIEGAGKALEQTIKKMARDISEKYLAPPATTDFGILFLPFEGLYAEVAGRPGLLEELQRTYRVNVAGPSTMAALLNSLQMGFQTVAIQQRASEIQTVLAAVKTEFGTYQTMLRQAQKQLGTVSRTVDTLVGTRSRAMERKLRSITELDDPAEAARILGVADDEPADGAPASKEN